MPKEIKDLEKRLLSVISSSNWPMTTEDIAKKLKISWQTAQIHLLKLAAEGKVEFKKVGRQNQWRIKK
jgi:predicted ArsR family transcriptional regulator